VSLGEEPQTFHKGFLPPYLDFVYAKNNFLHNTWKIEATRSHEKSVHIYKPTRRHFSEDMGLNILIF